MKCFKQRSCTRTMQSSYCWGTYIVRRPAEDVRGTRNSFNLVTCNDYDMQKVFKTSWSSSSMRRQQWMMAWRSPSWVMKQIWTLWKLARIILHYPMLLFEQCENRINHIKENSFYSKKTPLRMWRPYLWQVECVEFRPLVKGTRECPRGSDHPRDRQDHGKRSFRSDCYKWWSGMVNWKWKGPWVVLKEAFLCFQLVQVVLGKRPTTRDALQTNGKEPSYK